MADKEIHLRRGGWGIHSYSVKSYATEAQARKAARKWLEDLAEIERPYGIAAHDRLVELATEHLGGALPVEIKIDFLSMPLALRLWREELPSADSEPQNIDFEEITR